MAETSVNRNTGKSEWARWALRQQEFEYALANGLASTGLSSDGGPSSTLATFNRMHWISWSMRAGAPAAGVRNENRD